MPDFEMWIWNTSNLGLCLTNLSKFFTFTKMLLQDFILEGHISSFWEHTFFFEDGHKTQWFFNKGKGDGQIHTEIHGSPFDTFFFVFFLFEGVEFENFETSNIEDTNEKVSRKVSRESTVSTGDNPVEKTFENGLTNGTKRVDDLWASLTLDNIFGTDLDSWVSESL